MPWLLGFLGLTLIGALIADDSNKKESARHKDEADQFESATRRQNRENYDRIVKNEKVHQKVREAAKKARDEEA